VFPWILDSLVRLAISVTDVLLLIINSLVRYVEEFHIDGFRFDLASCLCRGKRMLLATIMSCGSCCSAVMQMGLLL
jgi:pullulanase/glycogen debranching enzyme